jgi:hypothetical protein
MLFLVVFSACAVSIAEIGSLAGSAIFHVAKGKVFAQAFWLLAGTMIFTCSAVGIVFVRP